MLTLIAIVAAAVVVVVVANWKLQFLKWDLLDEVKKANGKVSNLPPVETVVDKVNTLKIDAPTVEVEVTKVKKTAAKRAPARKTAAKK